LQESPACDQVVEMKWLLFAIHISLLASEMRLQDSYRKGGLSVHSTELDAEYHSGIRLTIVLELQL
jgi:hypothetical protein